MMKFKFLKLMICMSFLFGLTSCITTSAVLQLAFSKDESANYRLLEQCKKQIPQSDKERMADAYMCSYNKIAAKDGKLRLLPHTYMQEYGAGMCQESGSKSINDIIYCTELRNQEAMIQWRNERKQTWIRMEAKDLQYRDKIIKWEERSGKVKAIVSQPCLNASKCLTMMVMTPEQARKGLQTGEVMAILPPMRQRMTTVSDAGSKY